MLRQHFIHVKKFRHFERRSELRLAFLGFIHTITIIYKSFRTCRNKGTSTLLQFIGPRTQSTGKTKPASGETCLTEQVFGNNLQAKGRNKTLYKKKRGRGEFCNHQFKCIHHTLYMPTSRSASSNILFRRLIMMNCAFLVRS